MKKEKKLMYKRKEINIKNNSVIKLFIISVVVLLLTLLSISTVSAGYTRTNNYNALGGIGSLAGGFFGQTPGQFDRSMCEAGQDFVLQIAPGGCSVPVVRSDLLEEQNVPVYCQIAATQINPLVDVKAIDYISFSGQTPPEVAGVGFLPNKAALGTGRQSTLDNYPVLDNIGYAVIVLKRQPNESAMPNYVEGNLTAKIRYNIENAFGVGQAAYYLPELTEEQFNEKYRGYGFWDGRGFLKAESIGIDNAVISIYSGKTGYSGGRQKISTVSLKEGQTSEKIYMTGFNYCLANMRIRLDDITYPITRAKIRVNADAYEAAEGEQFLDGKCKVLDVKKYGINQQVEIKCQEDSGSGLFGNSAFTLKVSPKIELQVNGQNKTVGLGDFVEKSTEAGRGGIYVGYIGSVDNTNTINSVKVIFVTTSEIIDRLDDDTLNEISNRLGPLYEKSTSQNDIIKFMGDLFSSTVAATYRIGRYAVTGQDISGLFYNDKEQNIQGAKIKIVGFSGAIDAKLDEQTQKYYQQAIDDYNEVLSSFASEIYNSNELGKQTFMKKINFVASMQQKRTMVDLCKEFNDAYPNDNIIQDCSDALKLSSDASSVRHVTINGKVKQISFDGIYEPSSKEYSIEGYAIDKSTGKSLPISLVKNQIFYLSSISGTYSSIFKIDRGISSVPLLFKFENNAWQWSPGSAQFYSVTNIPSEFTKAGVTGGQMLTSANIDLIKSLASDGGKNYIDGQSLITAVGGALSSSSGSEYIQLSEIKDESNVNLITTGDVRSLGTPKTVSFKRNVPQVIGNYEITISQINIQRVAQVSVLPNIDYAGTETTFKFKIGIEKRSNLLKLSPEQAKDKIESLNDSIQKLDKISSNLGSVVKTLKTACLATDALFTVENLLANMDGKGLARQKVMRNSGGWYDQCKKWIKEGTSPGGKKYSTLQECLFDNSEKIDAEVESYYKLQSEQNEEIKGLHKIINDGGLFSEDVVNSTALIKDYSVKVKTALDSCAGTEIENPSKAGETIKIADIKSALSFDIWAKNRNYNFEELRDIGFYCKVLQDNPNDNMARQKLYSLMFNVKENIGNTIKRDTFLNKFGLDAGQGGYGSTKKDLQTKEVSNLKTWDQVVGNFETSTATISPDNTAFKGRTVTSIQPTDKEYVYFFADISDNKEYMLVLTDSYIVDRTFEIQGKSLTLINTSVNPLGLAFNKITSASYSNKYNNPEVRYFETEPFKGAPALIPLDTNDGWYVALSQTLPGYGNVRSFDESGRVYSYYLGNVGTNGNVDFFEGGGDDKYQLVVLGSKETFSKFSGLSDSKVSSLVRKAEDAIMSVQQQYPSIVGKANAEVNVRGVGTFKVGQPASNVPQVECEDFMSPQQCKILFNVCDPVICPSSRCNLGGAYPVADVVQTGVVGSIALCLPNIQEGIVMPVCLTGVKAGIDNWASIQKSYRDCLSEQIETGKTVGICDEIQSIYACEFFWRQSLPIAKIIIPTVISTVLGQNVRGGGEYLGVASAFDNAEKSVQYFTQYYGDDSFRAFKARTTDEVGGELCKSFASGVYPSSGNFLDSLTEADSPPQFTGRFDEIPFTTATNPPVSQYKVFYHIFAGKDSGAYFRVYLKGSPGSSYYQDTAVIRVAAYGYIPKGKYESKTVDFTAPSGYNQMCILVNGQEECGFKQVSTDFTLNYIQDKYASEQAQQQVTSESACISGTPSLYSMLNPNLQEGVSDVINPELYNQGIYRICATNNPGQNTDPLIGTSPRWVDVGYCGNPNLRCWLDKQSVKNVIRNLNIENDTVESINAHVQANLNTQGDSPNLNDIKTQIENEKSNLNKIKIINDVIGKFVYNYQKGFLLMMRGDVYANLAFELFKAKNDQVTARRCITSVTTGIVFNVEDVLLSIKTADDLNKWCDQNGGTSVCDGRIGAFTALKSSAITECPADLTETLTKTPEIFSKSALPITVRIVTYTIFGDNLAGDIFSKDAVYLWDGKVWSGGQSGTLLEIKNAKSTGWEDGIEFIMARTLGLDASDAFSTIELTCGNKKSTLATRFSLFSTNVSKEIRQKALELCNYPPGISTAATGSGFTCTTERECQIVLGKEILRIAREYKTQNGINAQDDQKVKEQTGAKNFECLVVQQAMQESEIRHCSEFKNSLNDPLYCNGNINEIKSGDAGDSIGIMQINKNVHGEKLLFEENVKSGLDILIDGYNPESREYICNGKTYLGWTRALRKYNGWKPLDSDINCNTGDVNYVKKVIERRPYIEGLLPSDCK